VLLVSLEDDRNEVLRRIRAVRLHYGIPAAELDGWLFVTTPGAAAGKLMVLHPKTGRPTTGELPAKLEAVIAKNGIGLVVLDPLVKAHAVDENNNSQMDAVASLLTDLASRCNVAVDAPHHVSKGTADPGNASRGRGASATNNAARLVFTLAAMSVDEAQRFNIPEDDRRDFVRMDRAKLNVARTSGPTKWFRLMSVAIGNETAAYPAGDHVQVVEQWSPPDTWAGLDVDLVNRILTAIDAGMEDGNFYTDAPKAPGREAWSVVKTFAPSKTEAQAREVIRTWVKNGLLEPFTYENPTTRKKGVRGLRANAVRRPG
jgi:hypothetical protein